MKKPDQEPHYRYATTGLEADIYTIEHGDTPEHVMLSPIPQVDKGHESWQRVGKAIDTPRKESRIGFAEIPPAASSAAEDSGTVVTYFYPWGANTASPVGFNEMAAFAAAHPENTILAIDSPATGGSSRLPSSVSREIAKTGSYMAYGEVFTEAMGHLLGDYQKRVFAGSSQGTRRAIAATACAGEILNIFTDELTLQDPVGSRDQSLFELMKAFLVREAAHNKQYVQASPDRFAAKAQHDLDSPLRMARAFGRTLLRGGLYSQLVSEPRAMAKGGLRDDLARALPYAQALTVSSAELSALDDPDDVHDVVKAVVADAPEVEAKFRVLKNQTHAMNAGHPGVLGVVL